MEGHFSTIYGQVPRVNPNNRNDLYVVSRKTDRHEDHTVQHRHEYYDVVEIINSFFLVIFAVPGKVQSQE